MARAATGVAGLDDVLRGGIPEGRTTLVSGSTGLGKTVFALQTLAHAVASGEGAVLVAFEEDRERLETAAGALGLDLARLEREGLHVVDARPDLDTLFSGSFDLGGLLAVVGEHVRASGARRVVIDALDVVLAQLPSEADVRRELARLHAWLLDSDLTALVTVRDDQVGAVVRSALQYLVDCAIELTHRSVDGVAERTLRVVKYRGSGYAAGDHPYVIDDSGISVGYVSPDVLADQEATTERVESGAARLDTMLGGGYYRGSSVLVTGAPGTAKTTLAGAFAAAACARGEPTLFVSYDSHAGELVRNLASVGIDLARYRDDGSLALASERAVVGSAEAHLIGIIRAAERHGARNLVIDPLTAIGTRGTEALTRGVVERLVAWAKLRGVTMLCTALQASGDATDERTEIAASTIADTWIHLSYVVHAGERNRALTIVKSRGTAHSNQVRELVLRASGIGLEDVYVEGGEVLMGTLRVERERATRARMTAEAERHEGAIRSVDERERELRFRMEALSDEIATLDEERERARAAYRAVLERESDERDAMYALRHGDVRRAHEGDEQEGDDRGGT